MATFTASAAQSTAPAFYNVNGAITRHVQRSAGGTAVSAGDIWSMVKVPSGAVIVDMYVTISGAAQSHTVTIGDDLDADRFMASQSLVLSQVVRLGGDTGVTQTGIGYSYSAENTIDITWSTVTSGTAANALVNLVVTYTCANQS